MVNVFSQFTGELGAKGREKIFEKMCILARKEPP
jgi:hypothetical protein